MVPKVRAWKLCRGPSSCGSQGLDRTEVTNVTLEHPGTSPLQLPHGPAVKSLTFRPAGFRRIYGLAELSGEATKETRFFLPSHPSSLRNRPDQPWVALGAGTLEEPASGPEGRQDPVPGSWDSLSPPLYSGTFLRGYEHVHTACTHTSRQTWEDGTGGRTPRAVGRGYERLGRK